ncbi:hypothetical protein NDU88_000713 [Pleurodeles waltl]|uniref:Uncharacterized protein n=1 Tax=Pleurodeles waltl TaxID=8319 RepID=A0AAV7NBC8_PLEWA|nr:hypothetical protein NDU88_000713 [Pleurodeles waltl]
MPAPLFRQLDEQLPSLVWVGKRPTVHLDVLKLDLVDGGLGLPDLFLYYVAYWLQYAPLWFDDGANWEKELLEGSVCLSRLPSLLMGCSRSPPGTPFLVLQVSQVWEQDVVRVLPRALYALYARLLPLWVLRPFTHVAEMLDFGRWRDGSCNAAGDLYQNNTFITQEEY